MNEAQEGVWTTYGQVADALKEASKAYGIRIAAFSTDAHGEDIGTRDRLTVHIIEEGTMGYREFDRFMTDVDGRLQRSASYELMGRDTDESRLESMGATVAYWEGMGQGDGPAPLSDEDRRKAWTTRTELAEVLRRISGPCDVGIAAFSTDAEGEEIGPKDSITVYVVNSGRMGCFALGTFHMAVARCLPRKVDIEYIDSMDDRRMTKMAGATVVYRDGVDPKGNATRDDLLGFGDDDDAGEHDPVMVSWERSEDGTVLTDCSGWDTWVEFHDDGSAVVWSEDDPYISCLLSRDGMEAVARYWIEMYGDR